MKLCDCYIIGEYTNKMLTIKPLDLKTANAYVVANHRHNGKVTIHRFSLGVYDGSRLCGVAICGNPVARKLDDGNTIEVQRVCTDGTKNACSILYSRCARVAKEMGYSKIITYTLDSESGISLKASGWNVDATNVGSKTGWNVPSRPRTIIQEDLFGEFTKKIPIGTKIRWCKTFTQ